MIINCFYQSKFAYTIVPWQIREDLERIRRQGADWITLNVLEQDRKAARENIDLVMNEAQRVNLKVAFCPERWVGIFGGVNNFPSVWTVKNMTYSLQDAQGQWVMIESGPISDPRLEETQGFIFDKLKETFRTWPFQGIVWDRPYLPAVMDAQAYGELFDHWHRWILDHNPDALIAYLTRANSPLQLTDRELPALTHKLARTVFFDHRGYTAEQTDELSETIAQLLAEPPSLCCYYDYPANVEDPERSMKLLTAALSA
ncbi:MAG: hypothetical protein AAFO02_13100 [Bacteroidota bacterium]